MRVRSSIVLSCLLLTIPLSLPAQRPMTLEEAIGTARSQSVAALQAKHAFVSTYTETWWTSTAPLLCCRAMRTERSVTPTSTISRSSLKNLFRRLGRWDVIGNRVILTIDIVSLEVIGIILEFPILLFIFEFSSVFHIYIEFTRAVSDLLLSVCRGKRLDRAMKIRVAQVWLPNENKVT